MTQRTGSKMPEQQVNNLNVLAQDVLTTPDALKSAVPLTEVAERTVIEGRQTIQNILDGSDPRLLVVPLISSSREAWVAFNS